MPEKIETETPPLTGTDDPLRPGPERTLGTLPEDEGSRRFRARKPRLKAVVIGAGLVLAGAATLLWHYYAGWESTDDAQIDGYINPISARVAGYVTEVHVDDNDYVKAGTLLVEIDPRDYQVALESARAAYDNDVATAQASRVNVPITSVSTSSDLLSAEADVENARAGTAAAQNQYQAAQASLRQAEANNARAQDDVRRYKQLVAKDEISQQQYEQAVQAANAAGAAVDAARSAALAAEEQIGEARGRLAKAEAEVRSAHTGPQQVSVIRSRSLAAQATAEKSKAALEQAQLNLEYTRILAPVNGVVGRRTVQVGQYVTPGQALMSIVPLDNIWVTANFKETQLKNMRPGQPARIHVDTYGRDYDGHVANIAGASGALFSVLPPENATGNYVKVVQRVPVKIVLDKGQDAEHLLRPGMSVEPRVKVN